MPPDSVQLAFTHTQARCLHPHPMEPSTMNRTALFALLATATAAFGAQANTYTDNARVVGAEPQY